MKFIPDKLTRGFLGIDSFNAVNNHTWTSDIESNKTAGLQEPTYIGFHVIFDWYQAEAKGNAGGIPGGLLLPENDLDSAIHYLRRIGYDKNAVTLKEFQNQLKNIENNKPWYFQRISGLNELWKTPGQGSNWRGKDKILTFETLETLDLQLTFLADLFKRSTFDNFYLRQILPLNMRRFNMTIILSEIRNLSYVIKLSEALSLIADSQTNSLNTADASVSGTSYDENPYNPWSELKTNSVGVALDLLEGKGDTRGFNNWLKKLLPDGLIKAKNSILENSQGSLNTGAQNEAYEESDEDTTTVEYITQELNKYLNFMSFKLKDCEFIFDDLPYIEALTNAEFPEKASMRFQTTIGTIEEIHQYGFWEWIIPDSTDLIIPKGSDVSSLGNFTKYEIGSTAFDLKPMFAPQTNDKTFEEKYADKVDGIKGMSLRMDTLSEKMDRYGISNIESLAAAERAEALSKIGQNTTVTGIQQLDFSNPDNLITIANSITNNIWTQTGGSIGRKKELPNTNALNSNVYDEQDAAILSAEKADAEFRMEALRKKKQQDTANWKTMGLEYDLDNPSSFAKLREDAEVKLKNSYGADKISEVSKRSDPKSGRLFKNIGYEEGLTLRNPPIIKSGYNDLGYERYITDEDKEAKVKNMLKESAPYLDSQYDIQGLRTIYEDELANKNNINLTQAEYYDGEEDIDYGTLRYDDKTGRNYKNIGYDETEFKEQIDNLTFDETEFKEQIDNLDFDSQEPKQVIDTYGFDSQEPNTTITPLNFEESDHITTVSNLDFKESDHITTVSPLDYNENTPKENIEQIDFDEPTISTNFAEIEMSENTPKESIDQIDFDEPTMSTSLYNIELKEVTPNDSITSIEFIPNEVKKDINQLDTQEITPNETVNAISFEENSTKESIENLNFDEPTINNSISPIEMTEITPNNKISDLTLEENTSSNTISPLIFDEPTIKTEIDEITLDENSYEKKLSSAKMDFGNKSQTKTNKLENVYSDNNVTESVKIGKLDFSENTPSTKINQIQFDNLQKNDQILGNINLEAAPIQKNIEQIEISETQPITSITNIKFDEPSILKDISKINQEVEKQDNKNIINLDMIEPSIKTTISNLENNTQVLSKVQKKMGDMNYPTEFPEGKISNIEFDEPQILASINNINFDEVEYQTKINKLQEEPEKVTQMRLSPITFESKKPIENIQPIDYSQNSIGEHKDIAPINFESAGTKNTIDETKKDIIVESQQTISPINFEVPNTEKNIHNILFRENAPKSSITKLNFESKTPELNINRLVFDEPKTSKSIFQSLREVPTTINRITNIEFDEPLTQKDINTLEMTSREPSNRIMNIDRDAPVYSNRIMKYEFDEPVYIKEVNDIKFNETPFVNKIHQYYLEWFMEDDKESYHNENRLTKYLENKELNEE